MSDTSLWLGEYTVHIVVIGDIHTQAKKFWTILQEAGVATSEHLPTQRLDDPNFRLVLLGDLFHAKSRERYAELTGLAHYDEYNPDHLTKAEVAQEAFLKEVKRFYDAVPEGHMSIIMGNHDFNAITPEQGPLRTDDVSHLEWKEGYGGVLDPDLKTWVSNWPYEVIIEGLHFAHVGPLPEHNTYGEDFYLKNRRRWIYDDDDIMMKAPHKCRLGIYGHTPVRGGVNTASRGRAVLLDTNHYNEEYVYLSIEVEEDNYRFQMRGLFFDEYMPRA